MSDIELFRTASIETSSFCNGTCETCVRNSYPNKKLIASWHKQHLLPLKTIFEIANQLRDMGFKENICLSHYNEPLLDHRLDKIIEYFKSLGCFRNIYFHTNGDYMTPTWAEELDGLVDKIIVSLYMEKKAERYAWVQSLFKKTFIDNTDGNHLTTHHSPRENLQAKIAEHLPTECKIPMTTMIINHRSQYLLCCEDVFGAFKLGKFPETSINDYWFGGNHVSIVNMLVANGRNNYEWCRICPR